MTEKEYIINGKKYYQRKLVPGQMQQLCGVISLVSGSRLAGLRGSGDIIVGLGSRLLSVVAIVITPEGMRVKDKDLKKIEDELFESDADIPEIVADFFVLNPIDSLLKKLSGVIGKMSDRITKTVEDAMNQMKSKTSSSHSQEEMSPSATT